MTQIMPAKMIVFFRPSLSASWVTASAPIKEPAGIAATIAPCAEGFGWSSYLNVVDRPRRK